MFNQYDYKHGKTQLENGIALKPLPFPGAIYSVGNGENIFQTIERRNEKSQKDEKKYGILAKIRNAFRSRKLTKSIRNEFSFYSID